MSGFVGIVNAFGPAVDRNLVAALALPLQIRGPAEPILQTEGNAGLGMTELTGAIPHLSNGIWLVGDVRLDARKDLIARFDPQDRLALSRASDPELVLHAYRRWDDDFLATLLGDFSLAIWDGARRRLLAARDPLGVKPFFFAAGGECLVFSNTLACIRAHSGVSTKLNPLTVADFLLFGSMKDTSATAFADIQRLPAGHFLIYEMGAIKVRRYWMLERIEPERHAPAGDEIERFRDVLQQAVNDRVAPAQSAILMSGGLDSTAIAATARKAQRGVKGFTVVYDHLIPDEERHYSDVAASFLNMPVEYLAADRFELFDDAAPAEPLAPEPLDEPLLHVFLAHLRQCRHYSSIALSGQGGDGLFATPPELGLRMLRAGQARDLVVGAWQYLSLMRRIPPLGFRGSSKRMFSRQSLTVPAEYPAWLNPAFESHFRLKDRWAQFQQAAEPRVARDVILDPFWSYLFEGYDAGFTGVPLEVRHPLLDLRMIRHCLSLQPVPWHINKTLLRIGLQDRLPPEIRFRPKAPVSVDPVAIRLANCKEIDSWTASPRLADFIVRENVPAMRNPGASPIWNLRPLGLNRWLTRLESGRA